MIIQIYLMVDPYTNETVLHKIINNNNSEESTNVIPIILTSAKGTDLLKVEFNDYR